MVRKKTAKKPKKVETLTHDEEKRLNIPTAEYQSVIQKEAEQPLAVTVTVKIAELRNRLSHYLQRVQRGDSILVCDRDRVVARIERAGLQASVRERDAEWLDRLERRGVVRRGTGTLSRQWLSRKPRVRADVVAALLKAREESP